MGNQQPKKKKSENEITKKIVVVGDGEVGKTCLIHRYTDDEFDEYTSQEYIATALDIKSKKIIKGDKTVELLIYDTGGQENFEHLRKINYPKSDAVIICVSISNPDSLINAEKMWIPEMKKMCPGVPAILVGTKRDLRDDADRIDGFLRESQGRVLAKSSKLMCYVETSSLVGEGVEEAFNLLVNKALKQKVKKKKETEDE